MDNLKEILLILTQEERDAAEEFVQRRMKLLGPERISDIQDLGSSARSSLKQIRDIRGRLNLSSKAGKLLARIFDTALGGYAQLVQDCNLAASPLQKADAPKPSEGEASEEDGDSTSPLGDLGIETTPIDERNALDILESTLAELDVLAVKDVRDACETLLKWWQSDHGQQESLHVNQYGDLNTGNGRMAIRKAWDELQQETLMPFLGFFQNVNLTYQKKNQERTLQQRKERLKQEASL